MSAGDARVTGNIRARSVKLDDRQSIVEGAVRLAEILDQLDRSIPYCRDGTRIADRDERRKCERRPVVPAFGDDLGADSSGVTEGNCKRWKRRVCHRLLHLEEIAD